MRKGRKNWKDPLSCRAFLDDVANEVGFDALNPENWYTLNLFYVKAKTV